MGRLFVIAILAWAACGTEASAACSVPTIHTLNNQTVDGSMTVTSGKRCNIRLRISRGPTYAASIVASPQHGGARIDGSNRIVYQSRPGYVGSGSFTYARHGLDALNKPTTRTVRIAVTVTP